MLSVEQNQRLTQVSAGTPMGELLRRYWHPISTTGELHENPVRPVRVMGEDLTLYRDRSGTLGLIGQRCAHRRMDLRWGIPQDEGLRCAYHGWTFAADGRCVAQPAEPEGSGFASKVRIPSYQVQELGGLIWAYMGPDPAPLLPHWLPLVVGNAFRHVAVTILPCNWLQCIENAVDPIHAEHMHGHWWEYAVERLGEPVGGEAASAQRMKTHHERVDFEPFEHGIIKRRLLEGQTEDAKDWATGHPYLFPASVILGIPGLYQIEVRTPIDDTHTWSIVYQAFVPGHGVEVPEQAYLPTFDGPFDETYIAGQDALAWRDQGEIADRSLEMLGDSDRGLIMMRRMFEDQMRVVEDGGDPVNVFRSGEQAEHLDIEGHDYGPWTGPYRSGLMRLRTTGPFSPVLDEIEEMLTRSAAAQAT